MIASFKFPTMSKESISLEETNQIRIKLGLKPLTDDDAPVDSKEQQAEDNYAKEREKDSQAKETKYPSFSTLAQPVLTCTVFAGKSKTG